jgi:hypothetical protein
VYIHTGRLNSNITKYIIILLKINRHGEIPEENWKFLWMVPFLRLIHTAMSDKYVKSYLEGNLESFVMKIDLPFRIFDWREFIYHAKMFFKDNFMPFFLLLSGGIGGFHYEKFLSQVGK